MSTQSVQLRVTLPVPLLDRLKAKAQELGLSAAAYVRHMVIDEVRDEDLPSHKLSNKSEEVLLKALEERDSGDYKVIEDISEFVNSL